MNKKIYFYLTLIITAIFFFKLHEAGNHNGSTSGGGALYDKVFYVGIEAKKSAKETYVIGVYLGAIAILWSHAFFCINSEDNKKV